MASFSILAVEIRNKKERQFMTNFSQVTKNTILVDFKDFFSKVFFPLFTKWKRI